MAFKIAVCGHHKFSDWKLLHRALDAVNHKHRISTLITGDNPGAEEMAYFWAANRYIREIITVPATPDLTGRLSRERRANDLLEGYQPDVVIGFSHPRPDCLMYYAERHGFKVWDVPRNWPANSTIKPWPTSGAGKGIAG